MTREEIKRQRIEKGFCACDECIERRITWIATLEEIGKALEKRLEGKQ